MFIVSVKSELFPPGDSELPENLAGAVLDVDLFGGERGQAGSQSARTGAAGCAQRAIRGLSSGCQLSLCGASVGAALAAALLSLSPALPARQDGAADSSPNGAHPEQLSRLCRAPPTASAASLEELGGLGTPNSCL